LRRTALAALACAALGAGTLTAPAGAGASAPRGLLTGLTDGLAFESAPEPDRAIAYQHAHAAGASIIRLTFAWANIEPAAPPDDATARDPGWPGYHWQLVDELARELRAAGFEPLIEIGHAPAWAEAAGRPAGTPAGTWRPSAAAFEQLAAAAARRYDGTYPDPDNPGKALPRVRYWQAWNEPNLGLYINPQWVPRGSGLVPASPDIYRALLNGWYSGMKSVVPSDVVVTAGTSPFGDLQPGGERIPPALFDRSLFCLRGRRSLERVRCPGAPVHFDVLAHHPYPIGAPRAHAPNPDDVTIADFSRLTRPLARALRVGTVAPRRPKQVWATEFGWVTNPPGPTGISPARAASYTAGDLSELWSERVSVALWFALRDRSPSEGPYYLPQGLYFTGPAIARDVAKPVLGAFAFPFTAYVQRGRARLWGLAPQAGRVIIERARRGGRWRPLARLRARGNRVFAGGARLRAGSLVRARQGGRTSLPWRAR
jgi:hypothetical protein